MVVDEYTKRKIVSYRRVSSLTNLADFGTIIFWSHDQLEE